nr:NAD(P)H-hydrate epimerase [Paracoccaceae bacterium]
MTELLTAAQMRAIEEAAVASGEVTGLELMERAGRGVVEAIFEEWPELARALHRAVVLCGPGNNGGDGFVVARLLKEWGWEVEVFLYGDPEKLPADARVNYERWCEMGEVARLSFPVLADDEAEAVIAATYRSSGTRLLVDALFGTGLVRPIAGLRRVLELNDLYAVAPELMPIKTVSVDVPSGLCADSGRVLRLPGDDWLPWSAVQADLTVPFHARKRGHALAEGPQYCGTLRIKGIGLSSAEMDAAVTLASANKRSACKLYTSHKYTHGHALILSGGPGRGGAARLAARGALRIGAGLVTVGCPPEAMAENASRLDAIMLKPVHDADALTRILEDTRISALCLGPGLGKGDREAALVAAALSGTRPTVLDADA